MRGLWQRLTANRWPISSCRRRRTNRFALCDDPRVPESLRLSVLDQVPIPEGSSGSDALHNSLDLARLTDRLGYHRYWVAEHHGASLASTSPEVLIGPIASITERMRIGSGGVMLPHYSAFKVAESFSLLAGLFPGRIDLGIGRAAGTDPLTSVALQRDRRHAPADDFEDQLIELLAFLRGELPADHPFARLMELPGRPETPEVWLLGSSPQSAIWAAEMGLPYSFADFINPKGARIVSSYGGQSAEAERETPPRTSIAAWVICADTDEEAERLASSARMTFSLLRQGQLIPVPPPEKALRYLELHGDGTRRRRSIIGSPETVKKGIEDLAAEYGTSEVIVVSITYDHVARRHSYELIAEAFGLARTAAIELGPAEADV